VAWSLAVLSLSGATGSAANTGQIIHWLLSWFITPAPAQLKIINYYFRKTGHFLAYGGMGLLWFRAFRGHGGYGSGRAGLYSLACCLACALLDEGNQWFHASRGASLYDVLLDMAGAGLAVLISGIFWTPGTRTAAVALTAGIRPPDRNNL
jgi:VanZ family protein